ncbi:MAG: winged helix-turn-helix transcriptional regulator [Thaumarchaeota archaeon]|nr:winged helix-turn-helix transcriptional regulator [Nitrososphaeria archaeon]NDB90250.1 winged helix-turn-helix transcriptional regulator [Nitrososphaerota archaeon]
MSAFILSSTTKKTMNTDDQDNTDKILQFIENNPGCHLRQIKRELNLSMGTLQYHLNLLEKNGKITSDKHSLHRNYFRVGMFLENEKNLLKILNKETERDILMYIIEHKNPNQMEIAKAIQISAPSVNWHISNLVSLGIITEERDGKFKRYVFSGNTEHVISLMKQYHSSIWDKWSNRLAEMFLSFRGDEDI